MPPRLGRTIRIDRPLSAEETRIIVEAVKKIARDGGGSGGQDREKAASEPVDLADQAYEEWRDEKRQSAEFLPGVEDTIYHEHQDLRLFREAQEAEAGE